jgi:hypothetical protein
MAIHAHLGSAILDSMVVKLEDVSSKPLEDDLIWLPVLSVYKDYKA